MQGKHIRFRCGENRSCAYHNITVIFFPALQTGENLLKPFSSAGDLKVSLITGCLETQNIFLCKSFLPLIINSAKSYKRNLQHCSVSFVCTSSLCVLVHEIRTKVVFTYRSRCSKSKDNIITKSLPTAVTYLMDKNCEQALSISANTA